MWLSVMRGGCTDAINGCHVRPTRSAITPRPSRSLGGMPMKRLSVMSLLCLLSACQSSAHISGPPEKTAAFPARAPDLSDCVYRFAQSVRSPYMFRRITVQADREFLVTATGSNAGTVPELPRLELRFITQGETTAVELRDTSIGDHELSDEVWAITERCSQQRAKPAATQD
jgi:hypothetical protein